MVLTRTLHFIFYVVLVLQDHRSKMSTKKRRNNSNEAATKVARAHSASPPKKSRLSTVEVAGNKRGVEAAPTRDRTHKPTSAPLQQFEPHGQQLFFSEGSRPKNQNERVTSRDHSPNSFPYSLPPHWFDSEPELPHAVPLADGESTFWKTEHAAFIRSAAGLGNAKWIGVRPLGSGGFGTAGLWELRDEDNAVTEVMLTQSPSSRKWLKGTEANGHQREQGVPSSRMDKARGARGGQNDAQDEQDRLSGCTKSDWIQKICQGQKASHIHGILSPR